MIRQSEIVVGAEVENLIAALYTNAGTLGRGYNAFVLVQAVVADGLELFRQQLLHTHYLYLTAARSVPAAYDLAALTALHGLEPGHVIVDGKAMGENRTQIGESSSACLAAAMTSG